MGTKLKHPEGPQRPSVPEAPVTAHGTQGKLFIHNQVVVSFGEYARGFIATLRHSRKFPGSRYNSWGPTESESKTQTLRTLSAPAGSETRREGKCLPSARSDRPVRRARSDRSWSASPAHDPGLAQPQHIYAADG